MLLGILAGLLAGCFWGFSFILPKLLPLYSASDIMLGRFGLSALLSVILLVPLWRKATLYVTGKSFAYAIYLSFFAGSLYYYLLVYAIAKAGVTVSTLIIGLLPITISLAGHKLVADKRIYAASVVCILGGIITLNMDIFGDAAISGHNTTMAVTGIVLAAAALLSWTYFSIKNGNYLRQHSDYDLGVWACLLNIGAFVTSFAFALLDHVLFAAPVMNIGAWSDPAFLLWCTVAAVGGSWLAVLLWSYASRILPTGLVGQLLVSETVFGLLYGFLYDERMPRTFEGIAIAFMLAGVVCGVRAFRAKPLLPYTL